MELLEDAALYEVQKEYKDMILTYRGSRWVEGFLFEAVKRKMDTHHVSYDRNYIKGTIRAYLSRPDLGYSFEPRSAEVEALKTQVADLQRQIDELKRLTDGSKVFGPIHIPLTPPPMSVEKLKSFISTQVLYKTREEARRAARGLGGKPEKTKDGLWWILVPKKQ